MEVITKTIDDLTGRLAKLQAKPEAIRIVSKKQLDGIRNQLQSSERLHEQQTGQSELVQNLGKKLEVIESGTKLANHCLQSVNGCRLAINKIPYREGENVHVIVQSVFDFLGINAVETQGFQCFRVPPKASKWSDRSISPTIIVILSNREVKQSILKRYFENHKQAKLSVLHTGFPLEYRFTVNEVLPIDSFRIRNLALRLKLSGLIDSVFVRNGHISVRLPYKKEYTAVVDTNHLLELTKATPGSPVQGIGNNESSVFFDAVSGNSTVLHE